VWWTTITIAAVAAWFEWQYRKGRRGSAGSEQADTTAKPAQDSRSEVTVTANQETQSDSRAS
jgi:hypothetical protein